MEQVVPTQVVTGASVTERTAVPYAHAASTRALLLAEFLVCFYPIYSDF